MKMENLNKQQENNERLRVALLEAKNSGIVENYDRKAHLKSLQQKYLMKNGNLRNIE